jgi:hypothetical protein
VVSEAVLCWGTTWSHYSASRRCAVNILLPIDESPFSDEAIREVEDRFGTPDTTVRVLHAGARFVPPVTMLLDAGGTVEAARAK